MRSIQRHQPRPYRTPSTLGPVAAPSSSPNNVEKVDFDFDDDDDDDFYFDDPPGRKCGRDNDNGNNRNPLLFSPTLDNSQRVPIKQSHQAQSLPDQPVVKPVVVSMHLPTSPTSVMFPIAEAEEEEEDDDDDDDDVASSVVSSNVLSGLAVSSTEVRCGSTNNSSVGPDMKFASQTGDELFLNFQAALERRENSKGDEDDNNDGEDKPESAFTTSTGGVLFDGPSPSSSWTTETTTHNVTTYNKASRLALLARSAALTATLENTVTSQRSIRSLPSRTRTSPPTAAEERSNSSGSNNNERDNSLRSLGSRSGSSRRKDFTRSTLTRATAMVEQQLRQHQQHLNEETQLQQGEQKRVMTVRDLRNSHRNNYTSTNKAASAIHDNHDDVDEEDEATRLIRQQLLSLQSQSHSSSATFRRALQRLSQDLRDSNGEVAALQVELQKAVAARDEKVARLQWARDMREREVEAVAVQMLHYHIGLELLHAESSPSSSSSWCDDDDERNEQRKAKILAAAGLSTLNEAAAGMPAESPMARFKNVPTEELRVRKQRLQGILDLCNAAKRKAKEESSFSHPAAQTLARAMKEDAASKYLLYDKFGQI